jgi:hypothetical protein
MFSEKVKAILGDALEKSGYSEEALLELPPTKRAW